MKSVKKEYIIITIVIALLTVYLVYRNTDRTNYSLPEISDIETKTITKIEIIRPSDTVILKKNLDEWEITEDKKYKADKEKISKIINIIKDFKLTALISESKSYDIYGLAENQKIVVKAWQGQKIIKEFEAGASKSSLSFVKIPGDYRVYQCKGDIKGTFSGEIDALRDKTVMLLDSNAITEIELLRENKKISFKKENIEQKDDETQEEISETVWKDTDGKKGDKDKIDDIISFMKNLRCSGYIYDKKKEDFTQKPYVVIALKAEEKEYKLSVFKLEKENSYTAISNENSSPFLLPEYRVENIIESLKGLER